MHDATPHAIYLKDYTPPAFLISDGRSTSTSARTTRWCAHALASRATRPHPRRMRRSCSTARSWSWCRWRSTAARSRAGEYALDEAHLTIAARARSASRWRPSVRIQPRKNTQLMGLYASKDGFFTQCEAEGFRRITYFIDRPDVMARYTHDHPRRPARFPVLLSNGNLVAQRRRGGRPPLGHAGRIRSPSPATCSPWSRRSWTRSRTASSRARAAGCSCAIYVEPGKLDQCGFAMEALKKSDAAGTRRCSASSSTSTTT